MDQWALYHLALNKDKQAALRRELLDAGVEPSPDQTDIASQRDALPSVDTLNQVAYLDCVVVSFCSMDFFCYCLTLNTN